MLPLHGSSAIGYPDEKLDPENEHGKNGLIKAVKSDWEKIRGNWL